MLYLLVLAAACCSPLEIHPNVTTAATSALTAALVLAESTHTEHAGGIYRCGDGYRFTAPQESGKRDTFRVALKFPKACTLVAIYHTHPDEADADLFSAGDIETACTLGVPSYIASPGHEARLLTPPSTDPAKCIRAAETAARLARIRLR